MKGWYKSAGIVINDLTIYTNNWSASQSALNEWISLSMTDLAIFHSEYFFIWMTEKLFRTYCIVAAL